MTPTNICNMMNEAYEILKTMTIKQIIEASKMAVWKMSQKEAALFQHQCRFAIHKKLAKKWN